MATLADCPCDGTAGGVSGIIRAPGGGTVAASPNEQRALAVESGRDQSPAPKPGAVQEGGWRRAAAAYLEPRVAAMLFLGFSAGLPFLLVFSTLGAWLQQAGTSRTAIGFFSWIGITYSLKVVWAPLVDRLRLPLLGAVLGRRRSWMLLGQAGIVAGLIGMARTDPAADLARMAGFALLVAFSSATQDVSVDAWRIEAVGERMQGPMAGAYQTGYRLALLAAGAGALLLASVASWPAAYFAMAALVAVGIVTVLLVAEPDVDPAAVAARERNHLETMAELVPETRRMGAAGRWLFGAIVCPFLTFFRRAGSFSLVILAFVSVYRISDLVMGSMANPFYLDLGFTLEQIAAIAKAFGIAMTIAGAAIGGALVVRYGALRMLLPGAVLVSATNLLFAWLATQGPELPLLVLTISADNLSAGFAGSVFIAYLSSLTSPGYTATQYALFSSLMTLLGKFLSGFSGILVDAWRYELFFLYAAAMGLPAIALSVVLARRGERDESG
jgi:PAT family beta-lactamase induction signal transducer AmpG